VQESDVSGVSIGKSRSVAFIGPFYAPIDHLIADQFPLESTPPDGLDEALHHLFGDEYPLAAIMAIIFSVNG
jgi:hypothetical protein